MSALIPSGNATGTGTMILLAPPTNGTQTVTIPDATGTVMVSGNMPAFSAYPSNSQSLTTNTFTKLQYNTKEFDTNSNYDNATNYRFTPTVAGYYSFTAAISVATNVTRGILNFYKNGSSFKQFDMNYAVNNYAGAALIYLNGSTDYVELYGFLTGVTPSLGSGSTAAFFQASLVRAA